MTFTSAMTVVPRLLTLVALMALAGLIAGCESTKKASPLGPRATNYQAVVDAARSTARSITKELNRLRNPAPAIEPQIVAFRQRAEQLTVNAAQLEANMETPNATQLLALEARDLYNLTELTQKQWAGFLEVLESNAAEMRRRALDAGGYQS